MAQGYSSLLTDYLNHLFQTVTFIARQHEEFINYKEKRYYLRILESQLADYERVILFYHWYTGFGSEWENDDHKYFTDYRMIHNLIVNLLIEDFRIIDIFKSLENVNYRKEEGNPNDTLFQFQHQC